MTRNAYTVIIQLISVGNNVDKVSQDLYKNICNMNIYKRINSYNYQDTCTFHVGVIFTAL